MAKSRLQDSYTKTIRPTLQKNLGIANIMQVPKVSKVVINVGVKEAVSDSKILKSVVDIIERIAGQAPVRTLAKKSIAGFKIREGMPLGVMVTLRRDRMYHFLDRLIHLALPNVRDFQGISPKLDGRGNLNVGLKEWTIFPEGSLKGAHEVVYGMNISIHTTAQSDEHAIELLKELGMPFKKQKTR